MSNGNTFTTEEEARIKNEIASYEKKAREAAIQCEIRNRILEAEREQPGKKFY